jgi:hypothetical protein
MSVEYVWNDKKWKAYENKIIKNLGAGEIDRVLAATAYQGQKLIVKALPKRTRATARSFIVNKKGLGEYQIASMNNVALFLEDGTKAHGPKKAKFLYIPLRPGAAVWRKGFVFGKDYILTKWVKGIKALHYLKPVAEELLKIMVADFRRHLAAV